MARKKTPLTLQQMATKILEEAEEKGLNENYFFKTTFDRYQTQLHIMDELKDSIDIEGPLVEKEYVKGRANIAINPAITEFNKTATAANQTVGTLIKILSSFGASSEGSGPADLMMDFLNS